MRDDGRAEVLCVDNLYTGSRALIAPLLGHARFELLRHDVTFPLYVECDEIYNLACPASPVHPIGPRSCYDEGKRCAETLFMDYRRQHQLRVKVARIFNTYGPHMHPGDGRVVSNFIVQALTGQPITLYGDGQQTRSFCHVSDTVDALMRLMDTRDDFAGPVNIGNPVERSMLDIARLVLELTGSRSPLVFEPLPQDDPRQRCPDIALAREELGWQPTVELRTGLLDTIAWFDRCLAGGPEARRM